MPDDQQKSPNVLLICVDQWSGHLLRPAGNTVVQTPTVSQLAQNGVYFPNAYSALPTCIPARRTLMTGTTGKTHGDRKFNETLEMPDLPTMAGEFARHGYQCYAVGKMHLYPQRERAGFHDALINEEGRHHLGMRSDDYEQFLSEQGYPGWQHVSGVCNNDYLLHPWHLPESCHSTNWTAREMCKVIRRRDPRKPSFWFLSFSEPHPPVMPPQEYLDLYEDAEIDEPVFGDWSQNIEDMPYALRQQTNKFAMTGAPTREIRNARRGFYASITHIDYQIRVVLGYLREQGLLDNTIIGFVSDHGDMLGDHHQWAKGVMLEMSNRIPFVLVPTADYEHFGWNEEDHRLVELRDVMPTLLDMAGLPIPDSVEGMSLAADQSREYLYAEHFEGENANRMIRDEQYKLIYCPVGNRFLLFDMHNDPREQQNLTNDPDHAETVSRLTEYLLENLYGEDLEWVKDGQLVGLPEKEHEVAPNRRYTGQRGWRFI